MPRLEFAGQSARDGDNISANPLRLVNCYREPIAASGRGSYAVKSAPGLSAHLTLASKVSAIEDVSRQLYAVAGRALYRGGEYLGLVGADEDTLISGNNGMVTVSAGGQYHVWDGSTITQPAPGAFSRIGGHTFISNYTVLTEAGGRRFQWSDVADPKSLPGLNFSTADWRDDRLIRPVALNGVLYLFKETSHEIWYVTGGAGAEAFERQAGGVVDVGLKAFGLFTLVQGGAFFVGDDGRAYLISGGLQPVSLPAVETAIAQDGPESCFAYEDEGHTFCAISFASGLTWVYDVATGEWHNRAYGPDLLPWGVSVSAKSLGVWYAARGNTIYKIDRSSADGDVPLVREMTSRVLEADRRRFTVDMLEVHPRQGFEDQLIELEVSRDGGLTWGMPKQAQIGPVGEYGRRVTWRGLGQARQFCARLRFSGETPFTMLAECDVVLR